MPNEEFSYANLTQRLLRNRDPRVTNVNETYLAMLGLEGMIGPPGFIYLGRQGDPPMNFTQEGKLFHEYKLKFHVSLPENDRIQFAAGWNIVKDILIM